MKRPRLPCRCPRRPRIDPALPSPRHCGIAQYKFARGSFHFGPYDYRWELIGRRQLKDPIEPGVAPRASQPIELYPLRRSPRRSHGAEALARPGVPTVVGPPQHTLWVSTIRHPDAGLHVDTQRRKSRRLLARLRQSTPRPQPFSLCAVIRQICEIQRVEISVLVISDDLLAIEESVGVTCVPRKQPPRKTCPFVPHRDTGELAGSGVIDEGLIPLTG